MDPARRALTGWVRLAGRAAWPVLVLALASAAAGLAYTARNIGIDTSIADLISDELPYRRHNKELDAAFPRNAGTLSVVVEAESPELAESAAEALSLRLMADKTHFTSVLYPEAEPFFRRNGLLYLDEDELEALSDRLAEAQPMLASLNEDPSIRGLAEILRRAIEDADAASAGAVAPALERIADSVERVAAGRPALLSWRGLMAGEGEPAAEARRKFIVAQPVLDFGSLAPSAAPIRAIEAAAFDLGLDPEQGYRVRVTGSPAMHDDELRSVRDGMGLVGLLSAALVLSLLVLGLHSPRLVLATLVTLALGLIWTGTFATLAIGALNLISVAFAVLFIGLSVDFGIHFALRYREAVNQGGTNAAALEQAAGGVGKALLLSAATAAIGFLSFLPTSYRGVSELGLISAAGMAIALFANLTVLPALLTLLPIPAGRAPAAIGLGTRLQALVERRARPVLFGALVLALAALAAVPFARFDSDPLNLRDPDSESVATLLDLLDDPRVQPYDISILATDLDAAEALAERLEPLPEVDAVVTPRDLVPPGQDNKLGIIEDMGIFLAPLWFPNEGPPPPSLEEQRRSVAALRKILAEAEGELAGGAARLGDALAGLDDSPGTLATLREALLSGLPRRLDLLAESLEAEPFAMEDLPAALLGRFLAADGRVLVRVLPRDDLRDTAALERFVAGVTREAPKAVGAPIDITAGSAAVVQAFREAALYAFALIVLLLFATLRRPLDIVMILGPLLLAALLTVAATVVLDRPFNFANVIVLPLLLGLGVAFGIQIVLRERGDGGGQLMRTSTPRAVLFSALTTIGSFCALALSSHRGTASMGELLTIAIGLTLVCTLVVLPALLAVTRTRRHGTAAVLDSGALDSGA